MAVRKSQRSVSKTEFLTQLRDYAKTFLLYQNSCPVKFRHYVENNMLRYSTSAYTHAMIGNSIQPRDGDEVKERRRQMLTARAHIYSVISQLEVFYEAYKSDALSNRQIEQMSVKGKEIIKLLNGVIDSDRQRYKNIR